MAKTEKEIKEKENDINKKEEIGNVEILPEVISKIVSIELSKIEGIDRQGNVFSDISEALGIGVEKQNTTKGIKVDINEKKVRIDINVVVYYGIRIPDVVFEMQSKVKLSVEEATGLNVTEVNVHVQGIKEV